MYEPPGHDQTDDVRVKRDDDDAIEYVGAPTEFADADEVPEWVENVAKVLFFLPTALMTATTIPFVLLALVVVICACLMAFGAVVGAV